MTTILTLQLDPTSQAHFDSLRRLHYPPALNQIPAHLTLFHTLPSSPEIEAEIAATATRIRSFRIAVTGLRSLGKGVAYTLASPTLHDLHARLAASFSAHLTPQDRQPFRPHVVLQNKATPEAAGTLLATLQSTFEPFQAQALGLDLWHYLGGPWSHLQTFPFAD